MLASHITAPPRFEPDPSPDHQVPPVRHNAPPYSPPSKKKKPVSPPVAQPLIEDVSEQDEDLSNRRSKPLLEALQPPSTDDDTYDKVQMSEKEADDEEEEELDPVSESDSDSRTVFTEKKTEKPLSKIGSCGRRDALFNTMGKACVDLVEKVYDQRICASTVKGARYLTCVPPKNGSSYHKGIIFRLLGHPFYYKIGQVHSDEEYKSKMKLDNFTSDQIASLFADRTVPKYAIVRNPLIRTLSGYLNSVEEAVHKRDETITPSEAFQNWIRKVYPKGFSVRETEKKQNPHVRTQFKYCGFQHDDFYKQWTIFKFEEPEKYVDFIYDIVPRKYLDNRWGDHLNTSFRDFVLGPRTRSHNPSERFVEYIGSLETFDQLASALQDETIFFGYQKEVAELRKVVEKAFAKSR